jgi:hypothetical protein
VDRRRNRPFPREDCNIPCPGDRTETCGGLLNNGRRHKREDNAVLSKEEHWLLISVFEIPAGAVIEAEEPCPEDEPISLQAFVPPSSYHVLGCIGSSDNFPDFRFFELNSYTSFKSCFQICTASSRYIAAGPTGCYCGGSNALVESGKNYIVPTNYCDYPCPTHKDEICGGEKNPRFPFSKPEFVIYSYQEATRIGDYQDFACVGSFANFVGLRHIPHHDATLEFCFEACKRAGKFPSHYVAAWSTGCYCADDDDFAHNANNFDVEIRFCNLPCPGTGKNEFCGGYSVPGANPPFLLLVYILDPIKRRTLGSRSDHNGSDAKLAAPDVLVVTTVVCADCNTAGDMVFITPGLDGDIAAATVLTTQL